MKSNIFLDVMPCSPETLLPPVKDSAYFKPTTCTVKYEYLGKEKQLDVQKPLLGSHCQMSVGCLYKLGRSCPDRPDVQSSY
jgi:hypothetical protein